MSRLAVQSECSVAVGMGAIAESRRGVGPTTWCRSVRGHSVLAGRQNSTGAQDFQKLANISSIRKG